MRNLKKFLAVLVVVAMIASSLFTMTAFAAADASLTPTDKAVGLGLIEGGSDGVTDEYLNTDTQRIQTAIIYLRLLGLEDKAKAYTATTDNFADADKVKDVPGATNLLAYLKANPQLGWVGDGTNFHPTEPVSGKALYKVMLTSLGYTQGLDFDYDDTIGFARAKGFALAAYVGTSEAVSNSAMVAALMEAVDLPVNGKTTTLAAQLVDNKVITVENAAKWTGYTVAPVGPFAITSVKSDNLIQLTVAFNAPLDATKGIDINNYTVKVGSTVKTIAADGISLSADKKTATILLDGNVNQLAQADTVTVIYAKAAAGTTADVTATSAAINDTTIPTVKGVTVTGNKLVKVTFSEPIKYADVKNLANYKIDGSVLPSATPALSTDGLVATLKLSGALTAGVHKVVVAGSDYANMPLVTNSTDITVATDTTAPAKVSLVGDATQGKVVVQFDKAVDSIDSAKVGSLESKIEIDGTDASKVTLTFDPSVANSGFLPASGSTITFTNVKDLFGNTAASLTLAINPVLDNVRPTLVGMSQPDNLTTPKTQFVLEYSKEVADPATNPGTYTLKDKDGNVVTFGPQAYYQEVGATSVNKKKVILTATEAIDGSGKSAPWTLAISGVKDNTALGNVIVDNTQTYTFADKTAPAVPTVALDAANLKIYVAWSEKMDPTTALNAANYQLTTSTPSLTSLPSDASLSLSADGKIVTILFPNAYDFANKAAKISVYGVKDVAGNVGASLTPVALGVATTRPTIDSARLTDAHTVVLVMGGDNLNSNSIAPYDFRLCYGSSYLTTNTADYALNADTGRMELKLTIQETLKTNATYSGLGLYVKTIDTTNTKSLYGQTLTAYPMTGAGIKVDDAAKATATAIAKAYYDATANGNTGATIIRVTTDEGLVFNATTLASAGGQFTVMVNNQLRDTATIASNGSELIFTLATTAAADVNKAFTVTFVPLAPANNGTFVKDTSTWTNPVGGVTANALKAFTLSGVIAPNAN